MFFFARVSACVHAGRGAWRKAHRTACMRRNAHTTRTVTHTQSLSCTRTRKRAHAPAKIKYSPTPMMKHANMTALRGLLYLQHGQGACVGERGRGGGVCMGAEGPIAATTAAHMSHTGVDTQRYAGRARSRDLPGHWHVGTGGTRAPSLADAPEELDPPRVFERDRRVLLCRLQRHLRPSGWQNSASGERWRFGLRAGGVGGAGGGRVRRGGRGGQGWAAADPATHDGIGIEVIVVVAICAAGARPSHPLHRVRVHLYHFFAFLPSVPSVPSLHSSLPGTPLHRR